MAHGLVAGIDISLREAYNRGNILTQEPHMADMGTPTSPIVNSAQAALDAANVLATACRQRVKDAQAQGTVAKLAVAAAVRDLAIAKLQLIAADAMVEAAEGVVNPKSDHIVWLVGGGVASVLLIVAAVVHWFM